MTLEQAIDLGKTDNEANWDSDHRIEAHRIRSEAFDAAALVIAKRLGFQRPAIEHQSMARAAIEAALSDPSEAG